MSGLAPSLGLLRAALRRFGRTRRGWALVEALARAVVAGPGLLLVWVALDWGVGLPEWLRLLGFVLPCLAGLGFLGWGIGRLAFRRPRLEDEACLIERLHGKLDNLLIGALQLGEAQLEGGEPGGAHKAVPEGGPSREPKVPPAPILVAALVDRAAACLAGLNPARLLDLRVPRRYAAAASAVLALGLILALGAPGVLRERASRLAEAWVGVLETLFPVRLVATPGDGTAVRGQPVALAVEARGGRRGTIVLTLADLKGAELGRQVLPLAGGRAAFTVPAAQRDFVYTFTYGQRRSVSHTIRVGDRPDIEALSCELTFPPYTGQSPRTLTGKLQRLQALRGTLVLVSLAATTELHGELAHVAWPDGTRQPLSINGRFAHFSFTVDQPVRVVVNLVGRLGRGFEMETPYALEVGVDGDGAPAVDLRVRGEQASLLAEQAAALAIPYVAEDDFGVAEVALKYTIDTIDPMLNRPKREGGLTRAIEPPSERVAGKFAEAFKTLDPPLLPGDRVRLQVTARDNNTETGPGVGRSRNYEIVIVRNDLAAFKEANPGFDRGAASLGGLARLKRNTDLMKEVENTVRTERPQVVERQALEARQSPESFPSGSEDAVGDYFRLLSGMK